MKFKHKPHYHAKVSIRSLDVNLFYFVIKLRTSIILPIRRMPYQRTSIWSLIRIKLPKEKTKPTTQETIKLILIGFRGKLWAFNYLLYFNTFIQFICQIWMKMLPLSIKK